MITTKLFSLFATCLFSLGTAWYVDDGKVFNDLGQEARIKGCSYFGFETQDKVVDGLWAHSLEFHLNQMQQIGINVIRVPFSSQWVLYESNIYPYSGLINHDPECQGKTSFQIMDMLFDKAAERGMGIMLDLHRLNDQYISELWYDPNDAKFTSDTYFQTWFKMLDRYGNRTNLVAIDLLNEPHGKATWGTGEHSTDWRLFAEYAISKIHERYPKNTQLIFVEGVSWSKDFTRVGDNLVRAPNADVQKRIVYSPHSYGKSVVSTVDPWNTQALHTDWDNYFGYLRKQHVTLIPGEWGGRTDIDEQWMNTWADYLISKGMTNNFFWSYNENSGDVAGITLSDWTTMDQVKLNIMKRVQPNPFLPLITTNHTRNKKINLRH